MERNNFTSEVIRRSYSTPVLVDFWAPWCGACKVLSPTLELLHERHKTEWVLVKINVEKYPILAERYNVTSIPSVLLFIDGEVADEFVGAIPGHTIEAWLKNVLPEKPDSSLTEAQRLYITGHREESVSLLNKILQEQPESRKAKVLLALQTVLDDPQRAMELVGNTEPVGILGEMAEAVRIINKFLKTDIKTSEILKDKAGEHFDAAVKALKSKNVEICLQELTAALKEEQDYKSGYVRDVIVALFIHLGNEHELTVKYRKEVSRALYS